PTESVRAMCSQGAILSENLEAYRVTSQQKSTYYMYKIYIAGRIEDLYTLSLIFPKGAYEEFYVHTQIAGEKDGLFDRVVNADRNNTFVSGRGCAEIFDHFGTTTELERACVAREIIAPLNGYAALADSQFRPVIAVSASRQAAHGSSAHMSLGRAPSIQGQTYRKIVACRHQTLHELMPCRVEYMRNIGLAARAAIATADEPSWPLYYRILEDIAGHKNTTLDKIPSTGLAGREALNAFKRAANNSENGRHGTSKRTLSLLKNELMTLREARQFFREIVRKWLDDECGGVMPSDRVEGGPFRFGLD
ncbi:hypothetical protein, partial [Martelella mediterranea]